MAQTACASFFLMPHTKRKRPTAQARVGLDLVVTPNLVMEP